jgi:hypothetical protein
VANEQSYRWLKFGDIKGQNTEYDNTVSTNNFKNKTSHVKI